VPQHSTINNDYGHQPINVRSIISLLMMFNIYCGLMYYAISFQESELILILKLIEAVLFFILF
jgi:hypothetical protein